MTQNLALGSTEGTITLTSADSNVSSSFVLPQAQEQSDTTTDWGDGPNTSNTPHLYDTGNTVYGNYYNWYAATAGTGLGSVAKDATQDICPKGWRLPDGGQSESSSFHALDKSLGGTGENRTDAIQRDKFIAAPYSFQYSGVYNYHNGAQQQGMAGLWWTRSAVTSGKTYDFRIQSAGTVYPQHSNAVNLGISVRCIASNQDFWSISTMQEMTPEIVSSVVTPSTTAASAVTNATDYANTYDKTSVVPERVLTDTRDGETYRVRKLADGNVWMTENLRLTLTEGEAIEISDGSMWLPTNYDGTTTNTTTLTWEDIDDDIWYSTSVNASGTSIVRSYDTEGSVGKNYCYIASPSGSGLIPHGTEPCWETAETADGETQQIGVYYNWYTATAGQGTHDRAEETTISICPRNWNLPSLRSTTPSYKELVANVYNTNLASVGMSFPLSFIRTGYFSANHGSPILQERGYFATNQPELDNTSGSPYDQFLAFIYDQSFRTNSDNIRKRNGVPIRCAISGL